MKTTRLENSTKDRGQDQGCLSKLFRPAGGSVFNKSAICDLPRTLLSLSIAATIASPVWAAQPYRDDLAGRNFDARILAGSTQAQGGRRQQEEAARLRQEIPDLAVSFDTRTGVTRTLSNRVGYLSGPESGTPLDVGLKYVSTRADLLGLATTDLQTYEVRSVSVNKATGSSHIYLRQTAHGLPLYSGQLQINVSRGGQIISINNAFFRDLAASVNTTSPELTALQAARKAAEHIGQAVEAELRSDLNGNGSIDLRDIVIVLGALGSTADPSNPVCSETCRADLNSNGTVDLDDFGTVLAAAGQSQRSAAQFSPEAQLMFLTIQRDKARLVWNLQIETPDGQHHYDFNVDAVTGEIWTRFDWVISERDHFP